jgi:hypothetical protein
VEDGMTNILSYREKNNIKEKRSREYYQRCAKTLLQVDGKNDDSYKINTCMQLEIIPQNNPYADDAKELNVYFEFKVNDKITFSINFTDIGLGNMRYLQFFRNYF